HYALPQEGEGRALVRSAQGIELISNVCRHRQAVMLRGRGNTKSNIVCPLHRWTYSHQGELIGAPHFDHDPCLNLNRYKLQEWNGLLFEDNGHDVATELAKLGPRAQLDFSGYVLDKVQVHECNYNWKIFIEVYLEDYHVGPFHPGLGAFVSLPPGMGRIPDLSPERAHARLPISTTQATWPTRQPRDAPEGRSTPTRPKDPLDHVRPEPPRLGAPTQPDPAPGERLFRP
ncbi:MAG TPA: Rieske 2Fe-2S domain-containing protein, partial [Roseateles sp.]